MKEKIIIFTKESQTLREAVTEYARGMKFDVLVMKSDNPSELKEPEAITAVITDSAIFAAHAVQACAGIKNLFFLSEEAVSAPETVKIRVIPKNYSSAVSEYLLGAALALSRHIFSQSGGIKSGAVSENKYSLLSGKTLGVVYLDEMTKAAAKTAGDFGMQVTAMIKGQMTKDQRDFIEDYGISTLTSAADIFRSSDFVLVHSSDEKDRGQLAFKEFEKIKKGSYLIDISPVDIIDPYALSAAVEKNHLAGAVIDIADRARIAGDVFKDERIILTYRNILSTREPELNAITDAIDAFTVELKKRAEIEKKEAAVAAPQTMPPSSPIPSE